MKNRPTPRLRYLPDRTLSVIAAASYTAIPVVGPIIAIPVVGPIIVTPRLPLP